MSNLPEELRRLLDVTTVPEDHELIERAAVELERIEWLKNEVARLLDRFAGKAEQLEAAQDKLDRVRKIAAERPWLYAKDLIRILDKEAP